LIGDGSCHICASAGDGLQIYFLLAMKKGELRMDENNKATETAAEDYEAIVPVGWGEGSDIFEPATWGSSTPADAQEPETQPAVENGAEDFEGLFRATGQETKSEAAGGEARAGEPGDDAPATGEEPAAPSKLKFHAQIDHTGRDVELDPTELPAIYEKSQALDRYKERLRTVEAELTEWDSVAKRLKYADRAALRNGVIESSVKSYIEAHPTVPEDMARDYFMNRFLRDPEVPDAPAQEPEAHDAPAAEPAAAQAKPGRDFKQEVADLFSTYAQARTSPIPEEVTTAAVTQGKPLVQAYAEYISRKAEADAKTVRQENKILKQNQASAARAPVSGVSGGGKTDTKPTDPFLTGFNEESW
jgi:hypothetical protein